MLMVTKRITMAIYPKELTFIKSHDQLLTLYFHLHRNYWQQTRQCGDLLWKDSTFKVTCFFDNVTNMGQSNKLKKKIFPFSQDLWPLNLTWWWFWGELPPTKRNDPLITWSMWSYEIIWQIKKFLSPLPQNLWLPEFTGSSITERLFYL